MTSAVSLNVLHLLLDIWDTHNGLSCVPLFYKAKLFVDEVNHFIYLIIEYTLQLLPDGLSASCHAFEANAVPCDDYPRILYTSLWEI